MLSFNRYIAHEQTADRIAAARVRRAAQDAAPVADAPGAVTIRIAREDDVPALADLAALDSRRVRPAHEPVLVAEIDGRLAAARDIDGHAAADPFRPTAYLLDLLAVRARQIAA